MVKTKIRLVAVAVITLNLFWGDPFALAQSEPATDPRFEKFPKDRRKGKGSPVDFVRNAPPVISAQQLARIIHAPRQSYDKVSIEVRAWRSAGTETKSPMPFLVLARRSQPSQVFAPDVQFAGCSKPQAHCLAPEGSRLDRCQA